MWSRVGTRCTMSFLARLGLKPVYFVESNHGELENINTECDDPLLQEGECVIRSDTKKRK